MFNRLRRACVLEAPTIDHLYLPIRQNQAVRTVPWGAQAASGPLLRLLASRTRLTNRGPASTSPEYRRPGARRYTAGRVRWRGGSCRYGPVGLPWRR